jgi:hypothetical protein
LEQFLSINRILSKNREKDFQIQSAADPLADASPGNAAETAFAQRFDVLVSVKCCDQFLCTPVKL